MERFYLYWTKGNIKGETTCNAALERMCERNSLPKIGMHDLRHIFATILIEQGMQLGRNFIK